MSNFDHQFDALMKGMAQDHHPELPSPGLIWWRARVQKKLAAKERIERPMRIMRAVSLAILSVVVLALLAVSWQQISQTRYLFVFGAVALVSLAVAASMIVREALPKS